VDCNACTKVIFLKGYEKGLEALFQALFLYVLVCFYTRRNIRFRYMK
jgi:hypothetical protein